MLGCHVNRAPLPGVELASNRPFISTFIEMARRMAKRAAGVDMRAAAIFVANPRSRVITATPAELQDLKEYAARGAMTIVAHNTYAASPWNSADNARFVRQQLAVCQDAGISGFVVHLPSRPAPDLVRAAQAMLAPYAKDVRIYLETPAVIPEHAKFETPAKLAGLLEALREIDPGLERFGVCIDTAHLWTSGVDLRSYAAGAAFVGQLEAAKIDPRLLMFHLNDSRREQSHGPDAHAALGQGRIWEGLAPENTGAAALLEYARRHSVVCLAEVNTVSTLHFSFLFMARAA